MLCIICDWPSPWSAFAFPQRYGNASVWPDSRTDDPICSVCREEIRKHAKPAKPPKWRVKYLTKPEKTEKNTLRQQAKRGQISKAESKGKIAVIEARSKALFLLLYQDKYPDAPPRFQIDVEDGGWLDFLEQHRRKTTTTALSFDDVLKREGGTFIETFKELFLDYILGCFDALEPDVALHLPEDLTQATGDALLKAAHEQDAPTGEDDSERYDHGYSTGFQAHALHRPPRDDTYDINHARLTGDSYKETPFTKSGRTTIGRRAKAQWKDYEAEFAGW